MASVNETVIVLIPKVDKPTSMRQLRPISLCTVIYKTVSKVLVNRMKAILPHCISSAQAAFVQGRAITDNILVAHELVHTLHTSVSRSSQGAVFKLDMEKAFDRVEWPFLKAVMLRLGFAPSWVDLIMRCVSSVSSRVRVRGALSEAFRPQRGLRQGDPLSPFLFLFCSEGLSAALTAAQQEGHLPGVRASKHGPPVNHLLFADDSLVFLRNNMTEVQCLKDILLTYSSVFGQKVNFSKSTAYFSPRTPPAHRTAVHDALGVQEVDDRAFTLGFPYLLARISFAPICQAVAILCHVLLFLPCSLVEEMSRSIRVLVVGSGVCSRRQAPFFAVRFGVCLHPDLPARCCCSPHWRPPRPALLPPHWLPPSVGSGNVNVEVSFFFMSASCPSWCHWESLLRDSSGAVHWRFCKALPVFRALLPQCGGHCSLCGLEFAVANAWPSALLSLMAAVLVKHASSAHCGSPPCSGICLPRPRALLSANADRLRVGFALFCGQLATHTRSSFACHNNDVFPFSSICPRVISRIVLDYLSSPLVIFQALFFPS
ncbi:hypothetical protein GQ457_13G030460 [Hibiscus cannabinus]